jgi:cytochrome c peroxidase
VTRFLILSAVLAGPALAGPALAGDTSPAQLIAGYEAAAGAPADAERGRALFLSTQTGGKPDTPSCTTCHGADVTRAGQTRTGKEIAPLAPSATPDRFTDSARVEKWLGRNCNSVIGRDCTPGEKADLLAWLAAQ